MNVLRTISSKLLVKIWDVHNEHLRFLLTRNIQYTYEFLVLDARTHTHTHSSSLLDKSAWIFDPRVCHITMYALCYIPPYIYPRKLSIDRFARIFSYPRKMHGIKINAPISRLHIFSFLIFFARARAHTHARTHTYIYIQRQAHEARAHVVTLQIELSYILVRTFAHH